MTLTASIAATASSTTMLRPPVAQGGFDLGATRRVAEQVVERGVDRVGDVGAPRDQHRRPAGTVLGLRKEIGRRKRSGGTAVGDDDHLRRPRERLDADDARDLALGGGDVRIARPRDHVDRGDGLGAVRHRRDRLRTTDSEHRVDTDERGGGERGGRDAPVGVGRDAEHDLGDAGDPRRDRGHQHGGRVRRPTPGNVEAGAIDRAR